MIIYAHTITPRLQYIVDFIGKEISEFFFQLTDNLQFYRQSNDPKINYSDHAVSGNEFRLSPHAVLFEEVIKQQEINCFSVNHYKAFFKTAGDFPFDIFAASFYLMSRYEEYLQHEKDVYGRYAHTGSLAFREGFLQQPLVNIWIQELKAALQLKFPGHKFSAPARNAFLATYDVDQAFSYKHKSFWKNAGGFLKDLVKLDTVSVRERMYVLEGKKDDPFDAYQWMDQLHRQYNVKPVYFFIIAGKPGKYDRNISPRKKAMKELIVHHYNKYPVGIHPSWQSGDEISLLKNEIHQLAELTGHPVTLSRQHYIRFTLPQTFRDLIDAGIQQDFSMGYGSINGFRASVASPFYWFDLEKNEITKLLLYPFCFMDANSFYEQRYSPQQAGEEMMRYFQVVKSVNGTMISIWHNNFLGNDKLYAGWKEAYAQFILEISNQTPSGSGSAGDGVL